MAWPFTPLTTYVAGSTPSIKAFDLNTIQATTNTDMVGGYSRFGLVVDGIGATSVTPARSQIKIKRFNTTDLVNAIEIADSSNRRIGGGLGPFGVPSGRISRFEESWNNYFPAKSAFEFPLVQNTAWYFANAVSGSVSHNQGNAFGGYPSNMCIGGVISTSGSALGMKSLAYIAHNISSANELILLEMDVGIGLATNGATHQLGFFQTDTIVINQLCARFRGVAPGNWQAETRTTGGGTTTVDTGVALSGADPWPSAYRMAILYTGPSTPFGQRYQFFINDAKVADISSTMPDNYLSPGFGLITTAASQNTSINVGRIVQTWNRHRNLSSVPIL